MSSGHSVMNPSTTNGPPSHLSVRLFFRRCKIIVLTVQLTVKLLLVSSSCFDSLLVLIKAVYKNHNIKYGANNEQKKNCNNYFIGKELFECINNFQKG